MRLLLLADIHFRSPNCLDRSTDPEWFYRNRLVDDLRDRVAREGAFDVILICGDIAFKGAPDEFAEAKRWIDELTDACGCDSRRSSSFREITTSTGTASPVRVPSRTHNGQSWVPQTNGEPTNSGHSGRSRKPAAP